MADETAVETTGLEKSYGQVKVLAGVDLSVPRGTVFSLLGPNGAGKTTTVRILSTLVRADAGRVRVAGFDVVRDRRAVRRRISLTGQYAALDGEQTGEENLRMMARLSGLSRRGARERARELLERFDLAGAARRRVGTYSGGMRRRLDIAASLVGRPEVLFLDEPTTGLDPRSRQSMWELVAALAGSGTTVFLTTQYLEEADRLAGRVALLDAGRVVAEGAPADLKQRVAGRRLDLTLADPLAYARVAERLGGAAVLRDPDRLLLGVPTDGSAAQVRALLDEVDPERGAVDRFAVHEATLDDVFLALTGRTATHRADAPENPVSPASPATTREETSRV
ncbi:daunorubicin resistance protein DrrA family ABC transporter ATP-binding protein [Streptomyces glaucosporus]|uniref:Daunorubicin resistance protein DrrA family ABC transporter ATP-binding protein n=1 Tax=Streptomyces glaucosporus TaxID=284044 RepID=A0ABN3I180_9ACTN